MSSKKEAKLTTVKKWENEFNCNLEYDINGDKVYRMRCKDCKRWESRISSMKNFSNVWISPGSSSVEKDSVKKHVNSLPHKQAIQCSRA